MFGGRLKLYKRFFRRPFYLLRPAFCPSNRIAPHPVCFASRGQGIKGRTVRQINRPSEKHFPAFRRPV
ncbi:hypothetical protein NEIELOOT_00847 [Neisseria elongata subsp. glycolytica ATCC 29315]|uniref:Uncharacterized protein n=1 Tax=Neisseria elongata subsp. glycolytica ATCC 29315 TaxID=546263 RepID=D4DP62_NEIEG|nr:hypothetical protein NEIELOOT_00847 [Neisseria elongata subsp. glycolytica ATCC 29315]